MHRIVPFTIREPARFDTLRWRFMNERLSQHERTRPLMPPAPLEQQARIATLRAIAYRIGHPSDQHPCSWWQEQPREWTTRITVDIETVDLRDLIRRIADAPRL